MRWSWVLELVGRFCERCTAALPDVHATQRPSPRPFRTCRQAALLDGATRKRFDPETRATLAVAEGFSAAAYIQAGSPCWPPPDRTLAANWAMVQTRAHLRLPCPHLLQSQKIRTRTEKHFKAAFKACDVILTPSTPITAPPIKPAALKGGEVRAGANACSPTAIASSSRHMTGSFTSLPSTVSLSSR